jgi:hypothetical protein
MSLVSAVIKGLTQKEIQELRAENAQLRDLVRVLLDNEPDDLIADGGLTVLDGWRDSARKLLG